MLTDTHAQYDNSAEIIHHAHYKMLDCSACGRCFGVGRAPAVAQGPFKRKDFLPDPGYICCHCGHKYNKKPIL